MRKEGLTLSAAISKVSTQNHDSRRASMISLLSNSPIGFPQLFPDYELEDGIGGGRGGLGLHHHLPRHERIGVSLLYGHLLRHAQGIGRAFF